MTQVLNDRIAELQRMVDANNQICVDQLAAGGVAPAQYGRTKALRDALGVMIGRAPEQMPGAWMPPDVAAPRVSADRAEDLAEATAAESTPKKRKK